MPAITFDTAIGPCALGWSDAGLTSFRLPGATRDPPPAGSVELAAAPAWIRDLTARVVRHLGGALQDFTDVPLDFTSVSPFARRVFEAARTIPAGRTCTYGDLAGLLSEPLEASRPIGAALGSNPWPLIVPCHRIVGAGGRMTGFSAPGGVRTKARLLVIEGAQLIAE